MDQTLCLQTKAVHHVWKQLVSQEPYKKQNLGANFKKVEEYKTERAKQSSFHCLIIIRVKL